MNKFCVLSRNKESYFINRLIEEVGDRDVRVLNPFTERALPEANFYLVRTTGVYHSDNDLKLLESISPNKIKNPLSSLRLFRNKLGQYAWFKEKSFSSIPYLDLSLSSIEEIEDFFLDHGEVIIKPNYGQGGWGVREVSLGEALTVYHSDDRAYLLQAYIKNAREVRYFFIQGKAPLIQERVPTKGVAANFQSAGLSKVIDLEMQHRLEIEKLINASGALYGAVDCFILDNQVYFLELNTVPGIEQAEKVSGRNLIREILHLLS